ncbi:MAG: isopentenyl-diphosphate Delta-isomerase [Synergistaceae bacterium]|jgi:isopentenyl-diphosphate delta-isomerase|nr:isopentenyl-diphosphate Delta-isomerase [Synergistaceae bacterium]
MDKIIEKSEKIILVDVFDRQTGTEEKLEAHRSPRLHRAFSVFIYHEDKMLIQRRAEHKYHSGGLWANACCSHPRDGELTEEAVLRRLEEELGIGDVNAEELFSFVYLNKFQNGLYEYEYDHVFVADYGGALAVNREEIGDVEWVRFGELARRLCHTPEIFASWFLIAAPNVFKKM